MKPIVLGLAPLAFGAVAVAAVACGGARPATPADSAPGASPSSPAAPAPASASSSSSSSAPSTPAEPKASAGACGVTFFGPAYDPFCQRALDGACCAEEQRCAADAACKALLDRVNACPLRRAKETDACVMKLLPDGEQTPGYPLISAIATCSKRIPPSGDRCIWPD